MNCDGDYMKKIYFLIALVIIYFVSVGYSAFETNLLVDNVGVVVRPEKIVRVTNVDSPVAANGAIISDTDFNVDNINGNIVLPNSNSTVTYMVTVTNIGNTDVGILNASVSGNGVDNILEAIIDSNDYEVGDKLCNTNNVCNGGISKSFRVTIKYKNGASIINGDINFIVEFNFQSFNTITYEGNVIGEVINGGNKVINLSNAPDDIDITGNCENCSYSKPNVILNNVTGNITITEKIVTPVSTIAYVMIENIYNNSVVSEDSTCENSLLPDDSDDQNLRYVGSNPCNYIYFNNTNWRIVGIFNVNGEKLIKIVNPTSYSSNTAFHNKNKKNFENWPLSSLAEALNSTFYQQLVTNGYGDLIKSVNWNVGSTTNNTVTPKAFYDAEVAKKGPSVANVGLLNVSDILYATSGPTNGDRTSACLNVNVYATSGTNKWSSSGCISSNAIVNDWLYSGNNEWTIDASEGNAKVYRMQNNAVPALNSITSTTTYTRTVVYLKENIKVDSGNGSSSLPYRISLIQ